MLRSKSTQKKVVNLVIPTLLLKTAVYSFGNKPKSFKTERTTFIKYRLPSRQTSQPISVSKRFAKVSILNQPLFKLLSKPLRPLNILLRQLRQLYKRLRIKQYESVTGSTKPNNTSNLSRIPRLYAIPASRDPTIYLSITLFAYQYTVFLASHGLLPDYIKYLEGIEAIGQG